MADKIPAVYNLVFNRLTPHITSALGTIPSSIVLGSGALSLLTFNRTLMVTTIFFIELILIHIGLAGTSAQLFPTLIPQGGFPHPTLFFIAGSLSYLNGALISFSDVFERIGGEYSSKSGIALILTFLSLAALISYYVTTSQTTFGTSLLTILLAFIVAIILLQINTLIFGKESVNILGVPTLVSTTGTGKPLYACGVVNK
jgi:hypothetical protein